MQKEKSVKRKGRGEVMRRLFLFAGMHPMRSMMFLMLLFAFLAGAFHAAPAFAQPDNPLRNVDSAQDIVNRVLCPIAAAMFWILLAVSVIMVLIGAWMYLTAGGDAEKVKKAHMTLTYAATGVVVAFLAGTFPAIIASIFSRGAGGRFILRCGGFFFI
jgi:hypothetical protein